MSESRKEQSVEAQAMLLKGERAPEQRGKRGRQATVRLVGDDALLTQLANITSDYGSLVTLKAGETIEAVLAGAVTTTNPDFHVSGRDIRKSRINRYANRGAMTAATPKVIVTTVPDGAERAIDGITFFNRDTVAVSLSVYVKTAGLSTYLLDTYSVPTRTGVTITPHGVFMNTLTLHSQLGGLTADDHTQYALLLGRGSGQTLIGGLSTGNKLILRGNSADADGGNVDLRRILITDNAADPAATGEVTRNGSGSRLLRVHDGTAVRDLALFASAASVAGDLPYHISTAGVMSKLAIAGTGTRKSLVEVSGLPAWGYPTQILSKSSSYPLVQADYGATVLCTAAITVTLPAPATVGSGWWVCIKKTVAAGSDVTIARNASETIDGRSASDVLKDQYATAKYTTDGTNWFVSDIYDFVRVAVTSDTSFPAATTVWSDATSLSIPPGIWDMSFQVYVDPNGATMPRVDTGIGTASGTGTTGLVTGDNVDAFGVAFTGSLANTRMGSWVTVVTTTTTHYLKLNGTFTVATPRYRCRLSAKRIG